MIIRSWKIIAAVAILTSSFCGMSVRAATNAVVNVGDATTFICDLTATNLNVTIVTNVGPTLVTNIVHAEVYKDENNPSWPMGSGIPIPVINLTSGQMVICRFKNKIPPGGCGCLDEGTSIHWHGIELDNDSDGTGVTQDSVLNGQSYTYKFKVPRPGLFWFHSHMMPGNTTFAGMYGAMIIPNPNEGALIPSILPTAAYTYTLAMSDIEFDAAGNVGRTNTSLGEFKTINQWAEDCAGAGSGSTNICMMPARPGAIVLVNGEPPISKAGAQTPKFVVPKAKRIRMRLLNEAITRNFRLKLLDAGGNQINLYRVGGQGGLLDRVRLEGGIKTNETACCDEGWDTGYDIGEVNIGSGDRVEVIALTPTNATNGQILRLVGNPLDAPFVLSGATLGGTPNIPANYPIAYFQINNLSGGETEPSTNELLLAGIGDGVEDIKSAFPVAPLTDPAPLSSPGTTNETITLSQSASSRPSVDGIQAGQLDGNLGNGDFLTIPFTNNTRYARVGDLLELEVRNTTTPAHPFHLHGFSMQPIAIIDNSSSNTLFTYDYNEFVDTIDVYGGQTLIFRVRLDDRPKFCDEAPSATATNGPVLKPCVDSNCDGALGRWLYHCHIFAHAGLGMINELVVLPSLANTNLSKVTKQPDISTTGVDVLATAGTASQMVADDFLCNTSGPITSIRIWGSWLNDIIDFSPTFELRIWSDVPFPQPSHPGAPLWQRVFPPGTYSNSVAGYVFYEEFLIPTQPNSYYTDSQVWRYDFPISACDAFYQTSGNIYWLSVTARTTNGTLFGWKTCITNDYFNDDATWSATTNYATTWTDLHYPYPLHPYTNSMDMAFELGTGVSTNCIEPFATFYGSPTSGSQPLNVTFFDTSTGDITNRFWDFGDGSTINVSTNSVSHVYTAGTYTVTLIVSGPCGDSTNTLSDYITVTCSNPPTANFGAAPTNGVAPLTVNFTAFPGGTITSWFWNFGDSVTTNVGSSSVSHTYTNAGTFSVTLVVSGPCGSSSITKTNYITVCVAPKANFSGSPTNGPAPLTVLFLDASTGTITNRLWSFGDTFSSSLVNPSHTYSNPGVYSVNLTVFGPCGTGFTNRPGYITVQTPTVSYPTWQTFYFPGGGPNSLPNADPDGDGMINTNEFLAGFNPTNNSAYLRIISIIKSNNDIRITYLGANGDNSWSPGIASRTNVLDFTRGTVVLGSNIVFTGNYSNNFVGLITNILSGGNGSGTNVTVVDPGAATNKPSRYYRVRVLLP